MNALDHAAMQALSDAGAQCGVCGDQPGDRICPDCERCYETYVEALRKAGWAPSAEVRAEQAAEIDHLREERDAFRNQRNSVFETNERLLAEVQESDQARLRAENETRTATREIVRLRARVAELERPAIEAKRNEIRSSYSELIATATELKDYEGAFDAECRLREREEQWAREDGAK